MLERVDFAYFLIRMTPNGGQNFTFQEHTCSRDAGFSLVIEFCLAFIIRRIVFSSAGSALCVNTLVSKLAPGWRCEVRTLRNMPIITRCSFLTTSVHVVFNTKESVRSPCMYFTICFGVPCAPTSSLPFPPPFEFRCGEPVG